MMNFSVLLFILLGVIGLGCGLYSIREYSGIIKSIKPISISHVLKLSTLIGLSSCLSFFALITLLGTIVEKKITWSSNEVLGLLVVSVIVGVVVFGGSVYQIYTTIKYRDLLVKKKILK